MISVFTLLRSAGPYTLLPLAMVALLSACRSATPDTRPASHVLVIVIDTLRADHLGTYGYSRDTTPFLDSLALEGTVFTHAVTTSSFTGEAISSLFTGQYPSATPWGAGWYARPAPDATTLAMAFQEQGYATALFSNSPVLDAPEFYRGFETTWCGTEFGLSGQGPRLVDRALEWLKAHADQPTFTYLHFLDPHSPYAPTETYATRFGAPGTDTPLSLYEDVRQQVPALRASGFGPGDARFEDLVRRYDGEIAFIDDTVKGLFNGLEALGLKNDTLAVITSDHGEEFLEHGFVEHAWTLYPEVHRIPLILWEPDRIPATRNETTVSLVDLMPTLAALQELVPVKGSGTPLLQARDDGTWWLAPESTPRIMELLIQSRCLVRAVIQKDTLYVAYWQWRSPEECAAAAGVLRKTRAALLDGSVEPVDARGGIVKEALYDLARDPGAQHDISSNHPEEVARWRAHLLNYLKTCPPQLPDRFKATRDRSLLTEAEQQLLKNVADEFFQPPAPGSPHDHALESLGYL